MDDDDSREERSKGIDSFLKLIAAAPAMPAPGAVVAGRFRLLTIAGQGGFGAVYRAEDSVTGRHVALKILRDETTDVGRFDREARLLSTIRRPNVVAYIDHGLSDQGARYLAMEWLDGVDLSQPLRKGEPLSTREALTVAVRAAQGLGAAHPLGVIHRDVKPANPYLVGSSAWAGSESRAALAAHDTPATRGVALATLARALVCEGDAQGALASAREAVDVLRAVGSIEENRAVIHLALLEALVACGSFFLGARRRGRRCTGRTTWGATLHHERTEVGLSPGGGERVDGERGGAERSCRAHGGGASRRVRGRRPPRSVKVPPESNADSCAISRGPPRANHDRRARRRFCPVPSEPTPGAPPMPVRVVRARPSLPFVLAAFAPFVFACGSSSSSPANGGASAASDAGETQGDDAGSPVPGDDASVPSLGGNTDAAADGATCDQVNIAILGAPGSDSSSNFEAWLQQSGTTVTRIQTGTTDPLTAAALAPYDVVILDQLQRDYTTDEAAVFAAWVQAGGGVASMSGYNDDTTTDFRANDLLAPLAVAYEMPRMDGPVTQFATSPITTGLTSVTFLGGYAIADLGGTASTRTPLATLNDTSGTGQSGTVSMAVTMGNGHAFVWGDEWIEYDSQWSTIPQIKQLWVQVFAWIAPSKCALVPPK